MPHKGKKRFRNKATAVISTTKKKKRNKLVSALKRESLIIKNLSFKTTEEDLREYFIKFGDICKINFLKKAGGNHVGHGIVQFSEEQSAANAIQSCDGNDFLGRKIVVDWAVPRSENENNAVKLLKVKKKPEHSSAKTEEPEPEEEEEEEESSNIKTRNEFQGSSTGKAQNGKNKSKKIKNAKKGRLIVRNLPFKHLPASVKRRIKALKKIQLETTNIEAKFYEEVHLLECKYHKLYIPLYEKRGEVISGLYEPTDLECEWESDDEKEEELSADMKSKVKIEEVDTGKKQENEINKNEETKGIPNFWLTIFKNVQMLSQMVQEHDEPIFKHLFDIKVIFLESNPMGFVLEFHFSQNEYFSNSVLTKEYEMKCTPDESDPFSFEGPEIYKCKGCIIDWKKGKNVTVKTIKKKQKHKSRGSVRTVTKTVQNDSFFNFFTPPIMPEDFETELVEETQAVLTSDFEIGHYIRERIVPRAILYYTGEALEDEDFEEEEEGEEGEEEEDDDDPGYNPGNNRAAVPKNINPADCKQQ